MSTHSTAPTIYWPSTRLIGHLGLRTRTATRIEDLYSRPVEAREVPADGTPARLHRTDPAARSDAAA